VIRQHPETVSARYLAPPLAIGALLLGLVAGLIGATTELDALHVGWLLPVTYVLGVLVASLVEGARLGCLGRLWLPLVLVTVHLSWGAGFVFGRRPGVERREVPRS
jgi:hypothetical protein